MQEEHYAILVCRGSKISLAEAWPRLKVWNQLTSRGPIAGTRHM
jgi:hypothetical protein